MTQYLDKKELLTIQPIEDIKLADLGRIDSYDEEKIKQKILSFGKDGITILLKCAIQIAIVGSGNKSFGFVNHNDEKIELINIFKKFHVKHNNSLGDKLEDDDLTPRRLVRFFRFQIQKFIQKNEVSSYLWSKYCPKDYENSSKEICFPGAEHLVETEKDADILLNTYKALDERFSINISIRIQRVLDARGVKYTPIHSSISDLPIKSSSHKDRKR